MLAVITSGVALAVAGGSRLETTAKANAAVAERGQKIYEGLVSNRQWMENCDPQCDLRDEAAQLDDDILRIDGLDATLILTATGSKYRPPTTVEATAEDMYRIEIKLELPAADRARINRNLAPFALSGIVTQGGDVVRGSLIVEVCASMNQIDERMSLSGCTPAGTPVKIGTCTNTLKDSCPELPAAPDAPTEPRNATQYVLLKRVTAFTPRITRGTETLTGTPVAGQPGVYEFRSVPAGDWDILLPADPMLESRRMTRWKSHESPTSGRILVEPNKRARALSMYRPTAVGHINFTFKRIVHDYRIGTLHKNKKVVPIEWAPTESFEGPGGIPESDPYPPSAAPSATCTGFINFCTAWGPWARWTTVEAGVPAKNCFTKVNKKKRWKYQAFSILGTLGDWESVPGSFTGVIEDSRHYWCSWYDLELYWDYYQPHWKTEYPVAGASGATTFGVEPRPKYRFIKTKPDGTFDKDWRPQFTTVPAPAASSPGQPGGTINAKIEGIPSGLNSKVIASGDDKTYIRGNGNTLTGPNTLSLTNPFYTWIDPISGVAKRPSGANVGTLNIVGDGECIWRGPWAGARLGICNPCDPFWDGKGTMRNSCTLAMRLQWRKVVRVTYDSTAGGTPSALFTPNPSYSPMKDWPMGEVPWGCSGILTGCRPPSAVTFESTTHTGTTSDGPATTRTPSNSGASVGISPT